MSRTVLTGPTTFYVSPAGADTNDGLTPATAWKTLQRAWNALQTQYDFGLQIVTVKIADGTYTGGMNGTGVMLSQPGAGGLIFEGNMTTPANVLISPAAGNPFSAAYGACFTVQGMRLQAAAGNGADLIVAGQGGWINIGDKMEFGNPGGQGHLVACFGGRIVVLKGYKILAGGQYHMSAGDGGSIYYNTDGQPGLIACHNPNMPTFAAAFACAINGGIINCQAVTWGGGAYGPTFLAKNNGVISTYNGNPNYFPGMIAGTANTGGQYN